MKFKVGDKVIYPYHGIAQLMAREPRTMNGEEFTMLVFDVPHRARNEHRAMTVTVPEHRAEDVGIRAAVSLEDAEEVLATLAVTDARVPTNWSRRFKNHQLKLKSGDLFECAEVVRNLSVRQRSTNLAAAEAAMYEAARYLVSSELALTWNVTTEEAEARMDAAMQVPAPAETP